MAKLLRQNRFALAINGADSGHEQIGRERIEYMLLAHTHTHNAMVRSKSNRSVNQASEGTRASVQPSIDRLLFQQMYETKTIRRKHGEMERKKIAMDQVKLELAKVKKKIAMGVH